MTRKAKVWLTTIDESNLLTEQLPIVLEQSDNTPADYVISVHDETQYQVMDGFGASLTDASAWLIHNKLDDASRKGLMNALFDTDEGIGISFLRQPMGASDYTSFIYSYNDMPAGEEDFELNHFSIDHDRAYIIPLIKEAIHIQPHLKVMASPWSPPGWMKTSGEMIAGTLRPECYEVYAQYFVKFVQAYEQEGIPIYAVSVQNEPGYEPKEYPGMIMKPEEEQRFIIEHLGPAFERAGIDSLIMCYDHNWDVPEHPLQVLNHKEVSKYIAGSAWHCYGGQHEVMSEVQKAYPNQGIWFTEASGGAWIPPFRDAFMDQMKHVIRSSRHWAKSIVWWNMALDELNGPTVLSNSTCRGLVLINQQSQQITYNLDYYTMGHISKFVSPGARRIDSDSYNDQMESVAFLNPDASTVVIVSNRTAEEAVIKLNGPSGSLIYTLPRESAITVKW